MKHPDAYRYPVIFSYEADGIHITVPDLPGCISYGQDEEEAISMAKEALALHLYGMEKDNEKIPTPSSIKSLSQTEKLDTNEAFLVIDVFMPPFREKQDNRSVKKTLSIPYWLNAEAERCGINFSQVLQSALKHQLRLAQ